MAEARKVLIIGLDGATWTALYPFITDGQMPNLATLIEIGTSGILHSTLPPLTPPAWASFQTGVHPGKHGVHDFIQYQPGSYKSLFVSSESLRMHTIWDILSKAGKRVILIGVPLTYPPQGVNGVVISGLLTPGLGSDFTYPAALRAKLLKVIGDYRFFVSQDLFVSKGLDRFLTELIYCENKRVEAAEYVFKHYEWDIAMIQFQTLDNLQHALWPLLDPNSEEYSLEKWCSLASYFRTVDRAIGKVRALAGDETNVILMSDHGFGPLKRIVFLNRWLETQGFLAVKGSIPNKCTILATRLLRGIDVFKIRRRIFDYRRRESLLSFVTHQIATDWPKTRCCMFSGSQVANIYLNLRGRDPQGTVSPQEYEKVREDLRMKLENLADPEGAQLVVRRVYYREEISSGDLESVPDLLIEPQDGYMFTRGLASSSIFATPQFGEDEVGCHRRQGIFVVAGPDFRSLDGEQEAHIVDVPATILTLMGIKTPPYFDGQPISFALEQTEHQLGQDYYGDMDRNREEKEKEVYSESEKQVLERRLRDLGYL